MGAPDDSICYIYVFGSQTGPIKVGRAMDVERRFKQIQAKRPDRLFPLGSWPVGASAAMAVEHHIHWVLRDAHISGEWFDAPLERAFEAIRQAINGDIDPDNPLPRLGQIEKGMNTGERICVRFPRGTSERLRTFVGARNHADFIREAVERELKRRERAKS